MFYLFVTQPGSLGGMSASVQDRCGVPSFAAVKGAAPKLWFLSAAHALNQRFPKCGSRSGFKDVITEIYAGQ